MSLPEALSAMQAKRRVAAGSFRKLLSKVFRIPGRGRRGVGVRFFYPRQGYGQISEAYAKAAYDNIHLHGGMGFTWEHDAHLYYRRARASEMLYGSPGHHRAELARALGVSR